MINLVLIIGLFLIAIAVTMLLRALTKPAGPSTETIEQIGAYGFAGALPTTTETGPDLRARVGDFAGSTGRWLGQRFTRLKGSDYRSRLVQAGMYTTTPERLLGTQFLVAVGLAFLWFVLTAAGRRGSVARRSRNRRSGRPRLGASDLHRRPACEEAPRAGRARSARI